MQAIGLTAEDAADAALRDLDARYRTLAEAAQDSIFIVDAQGRIEYINAVGCARLKRSATDATGRSLWDVLPQATADEVWRELSVALATNERHYFEADLDLPSGTTWFGMWCAPMLGERDARAVMSVSRDITDRKRLEREFAQAQKMESVGRLTGGVAHDFNNLLTAIIGYSDILADTLRNNADMMESLNEVRKAGQRASQLTGQLLAFSRQQEPLATSVDLNALVGDLMKMLRRVIGEDITLEVTTDPSLRSIMADAGQLEQVIVNLVVNARDAMPHGGTLRIATTNATIDADFVITHPHTIAGQYAVVTVQDTGCGMAPDVLARVFEPFFTTKPEGRGTGLGLSTVASIVKQLGGCITVDSKLTGGTTFAIYLPIQHDSPGK